MPNHEFDDPENPQKGSNTPQQNPVDRLQRVINPLTSPIACEECGSTYFYTAHAEQFASGGYGSIEFRSLNTSPMPLKICLCGHPLVPKQVSAGGSQQFLTSKNAFYASAQAAVDKRKKYNPDKLVSALASRADLEGLQKSLADLLTALTDRIVAIENASTHDELMELPITHPPVGTIPIEQTGIVIPTVNKGKKQK